MLELIPSAIVQAIQEKLKPTELEDFSFIPGGCINHGGILVTSRGYLFIKWNDRSAYPLMFEKEAKGLNLLRTTKTTRIPKVIGYDECEIYQFILLELIESKLRVADFWRILGQNLAFQHKHTSSAFGLDHSNFIGSLLQYNKPSDSWNDFFINQRLEVQINLARGQDKPVEVLKKKLEKFYLKLPSLTPEEKPALLHGDLWSGNLVSDESGYPCLIDPAVYYGHREAELAYTKLFDRFDRVFYQTYEEAFPLAPGFEERADIYNLYPLLVHHNLFGGSYLTQAEAIVDRFIQ